MDFPPSIYIALGAIAAAFISGLVSFVNLIIAKDQETSKFRQDWIDSLREELAKFVSNAEQISTVLYFEKKNNPDRFKDTEGRKEIATSVMDDHRQFIEMYQRIKLRLNPKEHKELLKKINKIHDQLDKGKASDIDNMKTEIEALITLSQPQLKKEWARVKRGEPSYYITKYVALTVMAVVIALAIFYKENWISIKLNIPNVEEMPNNGFNADAGKAGIG